MREILRMFDVIVVGARCAGAATALLLARSGYRVLLVERARFPKDTMSTLYIHQPGVALLADWGVLDEVLATGCPRLDRVTYGIEDVRLRGRAAGWRGIAYGIAPRRILLDQLLVDAAVRAGVEFQDGRKVIGLLTDGERVNGVRLAGQGSTEVRARLVVGADGMRSTVARLAGADLVTSDPLTTCVHYSMWHGLVAEFEFYERTGYWVAVIPTNDDLTIVATYRPQDRFAQLRTDALAAHLAAVGAAAPEVADRMAVAQRVGQLYGSGEQRNFFRQPAGPGWVLVGDAGHHKDSMTARGITDALRQADLLGSVIGERLTDDLGLAVALREFADQRRALLTEGYRNTLALARLDVSPGRLSMLRAISESADLVDRYFAVFAGISAMDELITPELLARI
jgi:2-polyprenyl-6-methoxyphenol hydroxylase-like FAD-dependent oxidoreductase